jgi:hypothetical protein
LLAITSSSEISMLKKTDFIKKIIRWEIEPNEIKWQPFGSLVRKHNGIMKTAITECEHRFRLPPSRWNQKSIFCGFCAEKMGFMNW